MESGGNPVHSVRYRVIQQGQVCCKKKHIVFITSLSDNTWISYTTANTCESLTPDPGRTLGSSRLAAIENWGKSGISSCSTYSLSRTMNELVVAVGVVRKRTLPIVGVCGLRGGVRRCTPASPASVFHHASSSSARPSTIISAFVSFSSHGKSSLLPRVSYVRTVGAPE